MAERYKHNPGGISRDTKKLIEAAGFQAVDEGETRRLGEMPSQGTPFETVISSLPASQIPRLAACLESLLTPKQKEELLRQL